jgi:hypothetical protein
MKIGKLLKVKHYMFSNCIVSYATQNMICEESRFFLPIQSQIIAMYLDLKYLDLKYVQNLKFSITFV